MASYTSNLNLKKPAGSENVAIGDINNNMDTIDTAYGTLNANATMARGGVSDANAALTPGAYTVTSGTINAAINNGILFTIDASGGRRMQIQFTQNHFYCRYYTGTSWGDWREITTTVLS